MGQCGGDLNHDLRLGLGKGGIAARHDAGPVAEILKRSTVFLAGSGILGGLCSVLGGYVSGSHSQA